MRTTLTIVALCIGAALPLVLMSQPVPVLLTVVEFAAWIAWEIGS